MTTDANEVVRTADATIKPALARLSVDETWLHEQGYHAWSAAYAQLRLDVERALNEFVDKLI